jgi:cellulase (glycosyl hydrolase family 5)
MIALRALRPALIVVLTSLALAARAEQAALKGLNTWLLGALPANLQEVRNLGVAIVRVELPWEQVEAAPDQFDWRRVDKVVEAAHAGKMQVLFTLRSISSWATTVEADRKDLYHHASRPKAMADWERFVSSLARRYKGQDVHYEIENEVNSNFWAGSLSDYLELLEASYRAVKAEDPQARVLASAMACGVVFNPGTPAAQERLRARHDEWLRPILATKAYDVVNVHDYYFPGGPEVNGWTFQSYLAHTIELMGEAGVKDRPIWITELGYVSKPISTGGRTDDGSLEKQAAWLAEAYRLAAGLGVERAFWLFLHDAPDTGYFGPMGLLDSKNAPRPAWHAYEAIGRR